MNVSRGTSEAPRTWPVWKFLSTAARGCIAESSVAREESIGKIGPAGYRSSLDVGTREDFSGPAWARLSAVILPGLPVECEEAFMDVYVRDIPLMVESLQSAMQMLGREVRLNLAANPFPSAAWFEATDIYWSTVEVAKLCDVSRRHVPNLAATYNWKVKRVSGGNEYFCDHVLRDLSMILGQEKAR